MHSMVFDGIQWYSMIFNSVLVFARNIWSVHCRNTEVEFQTNPMPYLKYRENEGRKIWNWVLWQIQLNGELEMLQRSRGSSFEVHSTAEIWFAQSWQIWNVNQPRNPMAKLSTESVARRPPASEEGGMVARSQPPTKVVVAQFLIFQLLLSMFWRSFEFLHCTEAGDLLLTSGSDKTDHTVFVT